MIKQTFTIDGRMPSLNDYIRSMNKHFMAGNVMKQTETDRAAWAAKAAKLRTCERPVIVHFRWVEKDHKRDLDNIAFAKKFILDGLVRAGIIKNDTQTYIAGFSDTFAFDGRNPRIEVTLSEF